MINTDYDVMVYMICKDGLMIDYTEMFKCMRNLEVKPPFYCIKIKKAVKLSLLDKVKKKVYEWFVSGDSV